MFRQLHRCYYTYDKKPTIFPINRAVTKLTCNLIFLPCYAPLPEQAEEQVDTTKRADVNRAGGHTELHNKLTGRTGEMDVVVVYIM